MTDLGTLGGGWSHATAINENSVVAGYSARSDNLWRAFTYASGVMVELGALPGTTWSSATDINDDGVAVGVSSLGDGSGNRAVSFKDGAVNDLGTLGGAYSAARAINNRGDIVGWSTTDGQKLSRKGRKAFLYRHGRMAPLDHMLEPGSREAWKLREATDINDRGQITGWGEHDGKYRIFLLTPIEE
jgi:probable HAF family extracellular repeat protein